MGAEFNMDDFLKQGGVDLAAEEEAKIEAQDDTSKKDVKEVP